MMDTLYDDFIDPFFPVARGEVSEEEEEEEKDAREVRRNRSERFHACVALAPNL